LASISENIVHVIIPREEKAVLLALCPEASGREAIRAGEGAGKEDIIGVRGGFDHTAKVVILANALDVRISRKIAGLTKVSLFFLLIQTNVSTSGHPLGPEGAVSHGDQGGKSLFQARGPTRAPEVQ